MTETATAQIHETKITVERSIKIGKDIKGGSEPPETIEIHKFATTPAKAIAEVSFRKSKQAYDGLWVAGEIKIGCEKPCYSEELPQATEAAYEAVKARILKEVPELLKSIDALTGQ
jgi:hypothetical protein